MTIRKSLSLKAAFGLLFFIIILEIAGYVLFYYFFSKPGFLDGIWFTALVRLLDLGLILFFVYLSKEGMEAIGLRSGKWLRGIWHGIFWSMGFGAIVFSIWGLFLFFFKKNLFRFLISPGAHLPILDFSWLILIGGILAPVVEDAFFVGCLYNSLRTRIHPLWSALGTALFFAFLHGLSRPPIPQFIGGFIFALAFEFSGHLLTPITIHIIGNCVLFAMNYSFLKNIFI